MRFDGVCGSYSAFICIVFLFLHVRQNDFSLASVVDRNIFSSRATGIFVERRFCVRILRYQNSWELVLRVVSIRGTAERETAEREFFPFFLNKKKKQQQQQQQTNSKLKYISQNKGHAYILYPSWAI